MTPPAINGRVAQQLFEELGNEAEVILSALADMNDAVLEKDYESYFAAANKAARSANGVSAVLNLLLQKRWNEARRKLGLLEGD